MLGDLSNRNKKSGELGTGEGGLLSLATPYQPPPPSAVVSLPPLTLPSSNVPHCVGGRGGVGGGGVEVLKGLPSSDVVPPPSSTTTSYVGRARGGGYGASSGLTVRPTPMPPMSIVSVGKAGFKPNIGSSGPTTVSLLSSKPTPQAPINKATICEARIVDIPRPEAPKLPPGTTPEQTGVLRISSL